MLQEFFIEILDVIIVSSTYGLIYGIMALGVFITFRILDFPDLTVDGSFPLGAAIMAILIVSGVNIYVALIISFIGGVIAGVITAVIHNYVKVPSLLAGILTMIMLYSINIRVLGNKANVHLLNIDTILTKITGFFEKIPGEYVVLTFLLLLALLIKFALDIFFHTDLGLILRAMGNNLQMIFNQGVNPDLIKIIGVGLSNGIVAIAGAFSAQYFKFADVNLGQGIIISGLASVMIGEVIVPTNKLSIITLRVLIGSIIYQALMYIGRKYGYVIGMTPNDLKLVTGLLVIGALLITRVKSNKSKKLTTALQSKK